MENPNNTHSEESTNQQDSMHADHAIQTASLGTHTIHEVSDGIKIKVSKYTEALVKSWKYPPKSDIPSPTKISVSQTVSFAAFLYEKMRNAVEFREEHLIRRATIERIIKRLLILNENGRDIAERLIKELLWARYYENNSIGEEKIGEIQTIIDKYFFIRNELCSGRSMKEQDKIAKFIMEVLSCEIQELLSPNYKRQSFTNYVYQLLRYHISSTGLDDEVGKDVQVYIAVEKTFAHSDAALIRFNLLKIMLPQITQITWKSADKIMPELYDVIQSIENALSHTLSSKVRNTIKRHIPPYLILRDVFEQNLAHLDEILADEGKLKIKVDEACRKRYDESKTRLRNTGIRSFIYILLTKVVFALIIEIPYDLYVLKALSYFPILINIIFPPALMALIILTVSVPGDDNTRRIYQLIKESIVDDPDTHHETRPMTIVGKKVKSRSIIFSVLFSSLYLITYLISFGSIIYVLSYLKFSSISQGIFIFFVTLVTFFAFKVIQITQEYQVINRDNAFTPIFDFFFLPIIRVGQWLSGEVLTRFNFLIFIFDFIIEMPFKAIVEVFDEWVHFVRLKKEEIV